MGRVDDEPGWFWRPDIDSVSVGCELAERLKPTGEVIGRHKVDEVRPGDGRGSRGASVWQSLS